MQKACTENLGNDSPLGALLKQEVLITRSLLFWVTKLLGVSAQKQKQTQNVLVYGRGYKKVIQISIVMVSLKN